jgi:hypothetical protein
MVVALLARFIRVDRMEAPSLRGADQNVRNAKRSSSTYTLAYSRTLCLHGLDSSFRRHQLELSKPSFSGTLSSSNQSCLSARLCVEG